MAGGAGYILSKESVIRYVEKGLRERVCDRTDTEDAAIGDCLHKLQVISGDVRDASLRERFFQFRLETALQPTPTDWWVEAYVWYKIRYGLTTCCSDLLVTAHKIIPEEMYLFEYLIYKVKVFGKQYDMSHELPTKMALKKVLSYVDKQNWVMNRWSNKSGT